MTKDKFIRFIKDNKHKFVFFNYRGGMGGETICNHLTRESDYFYNETLVKDIKDNKHHLFNGSTNWNDSNDLDNQGAIFSGYKDSNRNIFKDWMFGNMFMIHSIYNTFNSNNNNLWAGNNTFRHQDTIDGDHQFYEEMYRISDRHHRDANYGDINCVYGYDNDHNDGKWDHEWKDVDNEMDEVLERFAAQDKPYLIRLHGITPFMKHFGMLDQIEQESNIFAGQDPGMAGSTPIWADNAKNFKGAVFIDVVANEWERYSTSLSEAKVFVSPIKGKEKIKESVYNVIHCWAVGIESIGLDEANKEFERHTEEEQTAMEKFVMDYIGDIEEINLKTISVIIDPKKYEIFLEDYTPKELNNFVFFLHMFRSFPKMLPFFMRDELQKWELAGPWGTKINEPNHKGKWWKTLYKHERWWYDMINPQLYSMQEMFDGDWVEEQFGMDPIPMREAMAKWHEGNCKYLDGMRITDYLPKTSSDEAQAIFNTHIMVPN